MANSEARSDIMEDNVQQWRKDAQVIVNRIAKLKRKFSAKVNEVKTARSSAPKNKAIREKQAMRKAGQALRAEQNKLDGHVAEQAKRECRPLCEKINETFPQELRDMICDNLIAARNATFYHGKNNLPSIANGTSSLEHCFNPEYTRKGMHKDMIAGLGRIRSRFDFRGRHELLKAVFDQYSAEFDVDLAATIKKIGLVVKTEDLKARNQMLCHLQQLFRLQKGASICLFIETGGRLRPQIARHFRRVLRVLFPLLCNLRAAGYDVKIIANPPYVSSQLRNSSSSTFSIVPEVHLRYEITISDANFTLVDLEGQLDVCFQAYGDSWDLRMIPSDLEDD